MTKWIISFVKMYCTILLMSCDINYNFHIPVSYSYTIPEADSIPRQEIEYWPTESSFLNASLQLIRNLQKNQIVNIFVRYVIWFLWSNIESSVIIASKMRQCCSVLVLRKVRRSQKQNGQYAKLFPKLKQLQMLWIRVLQDITQQTCHHERLGFTGLEIWKIL